MATKSTKIFVEKKPATENTEGTDMVSDGYQQMPSDSSASTHSMMRPSLDHIETVRAFRAFRGLF